MRRAGTNGMNYFDCNCSFGRAVRPPLRFAATADELLAEMDFCGVDRALLHHTNARFASPVSWNPVLTDELRGRERLAPAWVVLPPCCEETPRGDELLAAMSTAGVRALWAFPQEHQWRLDRESLGDLAEILSERRIPLFVKENPLRLKELLVGCPDLIVVAVNQGPHSVERVLRPLLDNHPNLHAESSCYVVEGLIEEFCQRYGPERLLFGSGYPNNCSGAALLRLAQADISDAARAAVAGGNLERLLEEAKI